MRSSKQLSHPLFLVVKVVAILLVLDWYVAGPFFRSYVMPRYVTRFVLLRDRTGGNNLGILFDALKTLEPRGVRVAMVGDSTMNPGDGLDATLIPYRLGEDLRQHLHRSDVETIDCSEIGLYAGDAALFIAKLVGGAADVVVYGVALRAFPSKPVARWVSRIGEDMDLGDLFRTVRSGGGAWLSRALSAEQILTGLVQTHWAAYEFRTNLRDEFWNKGLQPAVQSWLGLGEFREPEPVQQSPVLAPRAARGSVYEWTRAEYGPPSTNWDALELIGQLCQRYAPGRCVLYAGPVNPVGRAQVAEPGLYDQYLARLRIVAGRYGLIWRDYTDTMTGADFRKPMFGGGRDPIHLNEQGRAKLSKLLVEPLAEAVAHVRTGQPNILPPTRP